MESESFKLENIFKIQSLIFILKNMPKMFPLRFMVS